MLYLKQGITNTVYANFLDSYDNTVISGLGNNLVLNSGFTELGAELVTNGDFATDSDWSKGTGWTISGGTANANTSGNYISLYQNSVFTVGKAYEYEFTVSNYSQGDVRFTQGGLDISGLKSANGTYTGVFSASQTSLYIQGVNSFIGSIDNVSVKELGVNWNNVDGNAIFSGTNVKIENISSTLNRIQQVSVTEAGKSYRVTYSISASTYLGELEYYDGAAFQPISIQGGVNTFDYLRVGTNNSVIINSKLGMGVPPYVIIEYITVQEIVDNPFSWIINITNDFTKESTTFLQIPDTSAIITPGTNTVSYPIKVITTGTANCLLQEVLLENTGYYSYEIYKQDSVTNLDITNAVVGKLVESGKALIYNADSEVTYKEHPDGNPNNFIYVP